MKLKVLKTFENLIIYIFKYSFKVSFTELQNSFLENNNKKCPQRKFHLAIVKHAQIQTKFPKTVIFLRKYDNQLI